MMISEDIKIDLSLREINQLNTLVHDQNMTIEDLENSILKKFNLSNLQNRNFSFIKLNGRIPLQHEKALKIKELKMRDVKITFYLDDIISVLLFNYNSGKSTVKVENLDELSKYNYYFRISGKEN